MDKKTKYNFLIILVAFLACITLGGLGNIAVQETFYWLPFVLNLGVYGYLLHNLFKKARED